tara:strand:- start:2870 stop:3154 length:285 start_codon:yes stop_codon:yes gene_type:complete
MLNVSLRLSPSLSVSLQHSRPLRNQKSIGFSSSERETESIGFSSSEKETESIGFSESVRAGTSYTTVDSAWKVDTGTVMIGPENKRGGTTYWIL